ncbi:MAG TPA: acyltransferase family protein [Plantibacter sp.]|uniref:acyltransferase family protein n=1 Tax=unclassified Plantibacter TaxID=2624265 RepID=UPI002BC96949|nr:acyltransferase family protein [Plantibacter sp.]
MPTRATSGAIRADLQGLRAVAVALVVLFHLRPELVPGGFIGVDVFFAISGFLITAHVLREVETSGSVRLGRFWARRARRLLPAALTVLLATMIASWVLAPVGDLPRFLRETAWSALYIENWALAGSSVDYLAAEASPSPVQHYWSLSVEEQFYLVWPLLIAAAAWVASRLVARRPVEWGRRPTALRAVTAVALALVFLASMVWSVVHTAQDPSPAYFATTTRAWEFAAGGLLAVVVAGSSGRSLIADAVRVPVAWTGLGAIGFAAFAYSEATPFPSATAAVPVMGTLAVIWAAAPSRGPSPVVALSMRPIQWLGARSYSVYLWHWPVLVLGGFVLSRSATAFEQLVMLSVTIALAEATTRWIETPIRFGAPAGMRPATILGATAGVMALLLAVSVVGLPRAEARVAAEQQRIERMVAAPPACFGAAALLDANACQSREVPVDDVVGGGDADPHTGQSTTGPTTAVEIVPDPSLADAPPERCITGIRASGFEVCAYGADEDVATRTVALIGDSHAEQWLPAFAAAAASGGWRLLVVAKSSCPFSDAERTEPGLSAEVLAEMRAGCVEWNRDARALLADDPRIDTIVVAARARNPVTADDGGRWQDAAADAYAARWADVPESIEHIIVLRDTPTMREDVLTCIRDEAEPASACARDRTDALTEDPQFDAAIASEDPRVRPLDLTDALCEADKCSPVIGDVLAYRDSNHLSWVYAATLAPTIQGVIDQLSAAGSADGR